MGYSPWSHKESDTAENVLMVVLVVVFKEIPILFSIVTVSVYIPTNCATRFFFSTSSLAFIVCRFFADGHSDQCEMVLR